MNIIQFKRGTNQPTNNSLSDGELYIDKNTNSLWIGDETETSSGRMFQIKAKPVLGIDIINANGTVIPKAIQDFTITNGTGGNSVFNVTYTDGSTSSKPVTLSGSVASATRLTSNAGADGTSGVMNPIYFSGGVPVAMTKTIGSSSKPVYINKGKVTECTTIASNIQVESTSAKYYLYGNNSYSTSATGLDRLRARSDVYVSAADNQIVELTAPRLSASYTIKTNSRIQVLSGGTDVSADFIKTNHIYAIGAYTASGDSTCTYILDTTVGYNNPIKIYSSTVKDGSYLTYERSSNTSSTWKLYLNIGTTHVGGYIYSIRQIG